MLRPRKARYRCARNPCAARSTGRESCLPWLFLSVAARSPVRAAWGSSRLTRSSAGLSCGHRTLRGCWAGIGKSPGSGRCRGVCRPHARTHAGTRVRVFLSGVSRPSEVGVPEARARSAAAPAGARICTLRCRYARQPRGRALAAAVCGAASGAHWTPSGLHCLFGASLPPVRVASSRRPLDLMTVRDEKTAGWLTSGRPAVGGGLRSRVPSFPRCFEVSFSLCLPRGMPAHLLCPRTELSPS